MDAPLKWGFTWQRAASFAARAHRHQMRDDQRTPYVSHPMRLALLVAVQFGHQDEVAICTALLHDVLEDTPHDYDDIKKHFGELVADCVACLTKDNRLPEQQREIEFDRQIAKGPWQARLVKLADVFDNLCDSDNDDQRAKSIEKAKRAIKAAGNDPRLESAIKQLQGLIDMEGKLRPEPKAG